MCLKIPSWLRGKGKFVICILFYFIFNEKSQGKDWKEKVGLRRTIVCLFANCSHFTILLWPHPVKGL